MILNAAILVLMIFASPARSDESVSAIHELWFLLFYHCWYVKVCIQNGDWKSLILCLVLKIWPEQISTKIVFNYTRFSISKYNYQAMIRTEQYFLSILHKAGCIHDDGRIQLMDVYGTTLDTGTTGVSQHQYSVSCSGDTNFVGESPVWRCIDGEWMKEGTCKFFIGVYTALWWTSQWAKLLCSGVDRHSHSGFNWYNIIIVVVIFSCIKGKQLPMFSVSITIHL